MIVPLTARAIEPQVGQGIGPRQRGELERRFRAAGQVTDLEAFAVGTDLGLEFARRGGVDFVEDLAQRGLLVDRRTSRNDGREIDLPRCAVAQRIADVRQHRAGFHAVAVVEIGQRRVVGELAPGSCR